MCSLNTRVVFNFKTVTTVTKNSQTSIVFRKIIMFQKKSSFFFFFLFFCSTSLSPHTGIQTQAVEVTKAVSL